MYSWYSKSKSGLLSAVSWLFSIPLRRTKLSRSSMAGRLARSRLGSVSTRSRVKLSASSCSCSRFSVSTSTRSGTRSLSLSWVGMSTGIIWGSWSSVSSRRSGSGRTSGRRERRMSSSVLSREKGLSSSLLSVSKSSN